MTTRYQRTERRTLYINCTEWSDLALYGMIVQRGQEMYLGNVHYECTIYKI